MELLYDTAAFLRLREAARTRSTADGLPSVTIAALADLRAAVAGLLGNRDADPAAFQELCWEVWNRLAAADAATSRLALPPCYRAPQVVQQVNWAALHLWHLERGTREIGDHAIYGGVKGIGKTTLLICIGAMAAVLLDRAIPIYWSFELRRRLDATTVAAGAASAATTPAAPVATAAAAPPDAGVASASPCQTALASIPTILALLRLATCLASGTAAAATSSEPLEISAAFDEFVASGAAPRYPVLMLDEFTELYFADAAAPSPHQALLREHGAGIMKDLHQLCKTRRNVFCLLAASRTDVEYYMCPERAQELAGYPTLNNTIFKKRLVMPIRDATTLETYIATRFGGAAVDGKCVLHATGGVGRDVAVYMTNPLAAPHVNIDEVIASPDLFALFAAILARVPEAVLSERHWPVAGIPYRTALDILDHRGVTNAARVISAWCDSMVLLQTDSMVEVLVPARLREFHERVVAADNLRSALILSGTIHKFTGGSPGASSESLICQFIHSYVGAPRSSSDTLVLDGGVPQLRPAVTAVASVAAGAASGGAGTGARAAPRQLVSRTAVLEDILGCVIRWSVGGKEIGIDRLWPTATDESTTDSLHVRLEFLQLKTGAEEASFDKGKLATERGRPTGRVSNDTFAGIMVKAERGLARLLPALCACFPAVTWSIGTFWVFSTKPLVGAADQFAAENPAESEKFHIRESPEGETIRAGMSGRLAGPLEFEWKVVDGVEWLRRILPADIASLL